jgi:hypothetical protein
MYTKLAGLGTSEGEPKGDVGNQGKHGNGLGSSGCGVRYLTISVGVVIVVDPKQWTCPVSDERRLSPSLVAVRHTQCVRCVHTSVWTN